MQQSRPAVAVAEFPARPLAARAVADLQRRGFNRGEISLVSQGPPGKLKRNADVIGRRHLAGAFVGVISGAVIGALAGAGVGYYRGTHLTDWGGLAAPLLGGLILGAVLGLLLGALTGMGLRRRDPHWYSRQVENARSVVTVMAEGHYDTAWDVLRRHGGVELGAAALPETELAGTAQAGDRPAATEAAGDTGQPAMEQPPRAPEYASAPVSRQPVETPRTEPPAPPRRGDEAGPPPPPPQA